MNLQSLKKQKATLAKCQQQPMLRECSVLSGKRVSGPRLHIQSPPKTSEMAVKAEQLLAAGCVARSAMAEPSARDLTGMDALPDTL